MKTLRKFILSVAFRCNFATFLKIWKKQEIFLKNPYTFDEKTILWTVLEILFFQSLFTGYYLPLAISKKLNFFFGKPICFQKQPNFCTFWEALLSQSFSTANFLRLSFSGSRKNSLFCFERPIYFFEKLNCQGFEKVYCFKHILQQNFYL